MAIAVVAGICILFWWIQRKRAKLIAELRNRKEAVPTMAKIKIKSVKYPDKLYVILCDLHYAESVFEYDDDVSTTYTIGECDICAGKTNPTETH